MPPTSSDAIAARLSALVGEGQRADAAAARTDLLDKAVAALVPDEALILTTLARTGIAPLIHIHCWTSTGVAGEAVLKNASSVGRRAGVALPDQTSLYVTQLLGLGLVRIGDQDERLSDDYQSMLGDALVLSALSRANAGSLTPRVMRHTLSLSSLGEELCALLTS